MILLSDHRPPTYSTGGAMTSNQQITLSLMTLGYGIAFFTILLRKKRKQRKKSSANAHIQVGDDIISKLPEEILVSIIARLPTKDARRTSLVSKRWRNFYKLVTHINLSCRDLLLMWQYAVYPHHYRQVAGEDYTTYSDIVLGRLDFDFRMLYKGYKIRSLQLKCCISDAEPFKKCFYYLQHLDVEALNLCLSCCKEPSHLSFPLDRLYLLCSLKFLRLSLCVLQPQSGCQSYSLQTLELKSVKVFPASLECILSTCLRLHSLSIHECDCPSKISIAGTNLQLKSLIIRYCKGVEETELCASNLIVLDFENWETVKFIFDHVPHLQTLHFNVQGDFYPESSRLTRLGVETFSGLRKFELFVCCTPKINLLSLTPLLQSCPLLEEFRLDLQNLNYEEGPQLRKSSKYHSALKKVEMSGFNGKENEIDFALSILCSAVSLEQMRIIWFPKYYNICCGWITMARKKWNEEMIQQKLQGQAISKNAQLIIDHIHTSNIVRRNINLKIYEVPSIVPPGCGLREVFI